jgi:hypothetical protein
MDTNLQLHRNAFGRLVFTGPDGCRHEDVAPARAFPITSPREGIGLLSRDGRELAWIPDLAELPDETLRLVEEELAEGEFMPEILRVRRVSGFATPSTWQVETDRGETSLVLKAEEDIRRLSAPTLLVIDSRGIQFLIRDPGALDAASRKILDRFL